MESSREVHRRVSRRRSGRAPTRARSGSITTRPWTLMEVCGGQTHAIVKFGVDELLPEEVTLVHGPGCPVCVTPLELIEKAIEIASRPGRDLLLVRRHAARARPVDGSAVGQGARRRRAHRLLAARRACRSRATHPGSRGRVLRRRLRDHRAGQRDGGVPGGATAASTNFSMLVSHVLVPPAMEAILVVAGNRVQGFLAAGHVCTVMGYTEYEPIAAKYRVPIVVTGFEPLDILQGVYMCVKQLEEGRAEVENQYARAVRRERQRAGAAAHRARCSESCRASGAASARFPRAGSALQDRYACVRRRATLRRRRSRRSTSRRSASAA